MLHWAIYFILSAWTVVWGTVSIVMMLERVSWPDWVKAGVMGSWTAIGVVWFVWVLAG